MLFKNWFTVACSKINELGNYFIFVFILLTLVSIYSRNIKEIIVSLCFTTFVIWFKIFVDRNVSRGILSWKYIDGIFYVTTSTSNVLYTINRIDRMVIHDFTFTLHGDFTKTYLEDMKEDKYSLYFQSPIYNENVVELQLYFIFQPDIVASLCQMYEDRGWEIEFKEWREDHMYELAGFSEFLETYFPKVSDSKEFAKNKILGIKDCSKGLVYANLFNRRYTFSYRYGGNIDYSYTYAFKIFVPMYSVDADHDSIELKGDRRGLIELCGSYASDYNDFTLSLDKRSLYLSMSSKLSILLSSAYEVDISDGLRLFISEGYTVSLRKIYEYCFYILKGDTIIYCFILYSYDKAIDKVKKDDVVITEVDNGYNFGIKIHIDGKDRDLLFSIDKVINKDSFELIDVRY